MIPRVFQNDVYMGRPMSRKMTGNQDYSHKLPKVNIIDREKTMQLQILLPGIPKDQVKIDIKDNVLTIGSEFNEEQNEKAAEGYIKKEFSIYGFERSFKVPDFIDQAKITAKQKDGVLTIELPKKEPEIHKGAKSISVQ